MQINWGSGGRVEDIFASKLNILLSISLSWGCRYFTLSQCLVGQMFTTYLQKKKLFGKYTNCLIFKIL